MDVDQLRDDGHVRILALLLSLTAVNAQSLEKIATERFPATKCPGLSLAVATKGQIVFSKAFGMADVEQGVVMKADSVHRLASLSKPITATILMGLVEDGKLSLDESVRTYLPELPAHYQPVKVRHLLTHQSGVKGYSDPADVAFSVRHYPTSRDSAKTFVDQPLAFEPGTKTEYASLSFTVAGAVAESITKKSFQQVAQDFFVKHAIAGFSLDDSLAIVPKRVRGYLVDPASAITFNDGRVMSRDYLAGSRADITNARAADVSNRYPAAGFTASAEDLLRFTLALADGKVLKPQSIKQLWTAAKTSSGAQGPFGLGWGVSQWKGRQMVGMNGAGPGTTTFLRYFPESKSGLAMLCNAEGGQRLSQLLDELLGAVFEPETQ